jgi:hypothetical protein
MSHELPIRIREIRGREYRVTLPGFDDFGRLSAELGHAGASILGLIRGFSEDEADRAAAPPLDVSIRSVARDVLGAVDGRGLSLLCADLFWNNRDESNNRDRWTPLRSSKDRDGAWRGRYAEGVEVIAWVLKEIFGPFFSEIGGLWTELSGLLVGPENETDQG